MTTSGSARWLLVTEGGNGLSRAAVAVVRLAAAAGYLAAVTESHRFSLAGASRYCARRIPVPHASRDPQAYVAAVRRELSSRDYLGVIPCGEDALAALQIAPREFTDKVSWIVAARSAGLDVPPTTVFQSAEDFYAAARHLDYPLVVKPTTKRYTAIRVRESSELPSALPDNGAVLVQPFLESPLRGVVGAMWRGRLLGAAHLRYLRLWPLPCGTVAAAETVSPDLALEEQLRVLLASHEGLFHVDLAGRHLLDVNLRAHATLPLAAAAGADLVRAYCDALAGRESAPVRAGAGVFFRWIEGDVRSLVYQVRRGAIAPAAALRELLPRPRETHGYESFSDPGPLMARLRYAARRTRRSVPEPELTTRSA